ncbi:unnamed protein product [Cylindrotheca closterium]|uniref:AB hydrolase-1 domain-containing protein n=1 Tax=Cylindrotheca closterium TaxID=2856 RepID=A0AAD2FZE1_9STRA|nr:unnamed protein product [Cylindrotheca closterium]
MGCMKPKICHKSGEVLTSEEAGRYALIPFDASNPDESNDLKKNNTVYSYTKECFEEVSTLDFSRTYDIVEPSTSTSSSKTATFVMVHGGGASRQMFQAHAKILAEKGHRSILVDLPGHGTLTEAKLTLESCAETVKSVLDENQESLKLTKANTIYVGASFGAYTGFYTMDKLKDRFCGAILMDCGQNVGPDCSFKASAGLWFLKMISKNMSNASLMGTFKDVTAKSPADWKLIESTFGAGMFFDSAVDQVEVLHSVKPADHIPNLDFPILFMNGSEDYRDSEKLWLSLCKVQEGSSLKVFEGGDHFFTHDSRFVSEMMDMMDTFAKDRMN